MPNPADLLKIQKENLTDEQIAMDTIREDAFEAGRQDEINFRTKIENRVRKERLEK